MLSANSDVAKIDLNIATLFEKYNFTSVAQWDINTLPAQRCSDDKYIPDDQVVDYYRNLDYRMIEYIDYPSRVIEGMVKYSFWLVTSFSLQGIQSPMNMYLENHYANIHPGKKRYIVANYMALDSVPVLVQQLKTQTRIHGVHITNVNQLIDLYGNNVSMQVSKKYGQEVLECSWHGATNLRDKNDYDGWWQAAGESINHNNVILEYLLKEGLPVQFNGPAQSINTTTQYITCIHADAHHMQFYIDIPDVKYLNEDLWKLYFHFDPRVGVKECVETGIRIINKFGNPDWIIKVNLKKTLERPWIADPEKT
jgi:hypothetical protein